MKSSLGNTLRMIRKSKNISIEAIADEHLSKSQISRFERGESEISCIRLINLLNKLNVSIEEFFIIHNKNFTQLKNFTSLMKDIRKLYIAGQLDEITLCLTNSPYQLNSIEKTMIKSIIYTLDNSIKPNDTELLELTDYLFKVEIWGYYEIILLANCVRTINYPTFFLLTKEMLKNHIYYSLHDTNKKIVAQLAINCLISSIDYEEVNNCTYLINEIEKLLNNELNYYEKTVFLYAQGYFEYKNKLDSRKTKMKQALRIFELLDDQGMLSHYTQHYSNLI